MPGGQMEQKYVTISYQKQQGIYYLIILGLIV